MLKVLTLVLLAFGAQSAFAKGPIGPAGCGLGHAIFGKENQVLAATTNGTFYNQIFGITSGTLECDRGGRATAMAMFVESNRVALANESARGQGETVHALSNILGCQDSAALGASLKANYAEIFANQDNSIAISNSIQQTVEKSPALSQTCQPIS